MARAGRGESLFRSLQTARQGRPTGMPRPSVMNAEWVGREAARAAGAAERLRAYRQVLAAARDRKARHGSSPGLEAEALAQARQAQEDVRSVTGVALRLSRHLEAANVLGETLGAVREALAGSGSVRLGELLADVVAIPRARDALREVGLSPATIEALSDVVGEAGITAEADDAGVRMRSPRLGRDVRLVHRPRSARPSSPGELIFGSAFEAAVAGWEGSAPFAFDLAEARLASSSGPLVREPLEVVLAAAVAARREMARHVRKLEDTGLDVHAGGDPATAFTVAGVLGLAAAVALIAGGALLAICAASSSISPGDDLCIAGDFLAAIGFFLLAASLVSAVIGVVLQTAASASS